MVHRGGAVRSVHHRPLSNAKASKPQASYTSKLFTTVLYCRMLYLLSGCIFEQLLLCVIGHTEHQ
jgi:hypothetical protein